MHSLITKSTWLAGCIPKTVRQVRQRGLREAVGWACYRSYEAYREWRLGIDTHGFISREDLAIGTDCIDYEPASYGCLDTALRHLDQHHRGEVFLDYGCGKGRGVVLAATYPFRRVIGVEISPELSASARENIQRARRRLKCPEVQVVTTDASAFPFPDEVTAVFLFNPFQGQVLADVQQQIRASLLRAPRRLTLIDVHPLKQPDSFASCDWLKLGCDLPSGAWQGDVRFRVYEA